MRAEKRKSPGETPPQNNLQSVVISIGRSFQLINSGKLRIDGIEGAALLQTLHWSRRSLIDVPQAEQLRAFRTYITNLQHGALDNSPLNVEVVALNVWCSHMLVNTKHGERRHG